MISMHLGMKPISISYKATFDSSVVLWCSIPIFAFYIDIDIHMRRIHEIKNERDGSRRKWKSPLKTKRFNDKRPIDGYTK